MAKSKIKKSPSSRPRPSGNFSLERTKDKKHFLLPMSDDYHVALADAGDVDLVALMIDKLLRESFHPEDLPASEEIQQTTEYLLNDGRYQAILAYREDNQAVGVMTMVEGVALRSKGRYGQIMGIYVDPKERSQGVGNAMMDFLKQYAEEHYWSRLEVIIPTRGDNKLAMDFFHQVGFTTTGRSMTMVL